MRIRFRLGIIPSIINNSCFSKSIGRRVVGYQILIFLVCLSSASAEITQVTSTDGITLQFTLPKLVTSDVVRDNVRYQEVDYADCHFTNEPGNPKVPVTRVMLGVPATATIEAVDVSAAPMETHSNVRLVPVSIFDITNNSRLSKSIGRRVVGYHERDSQHSASQRWIESGSAYRSKGNTSFGANSSYPGHPLARIVREGYIRSQRVIALTLYPVQYVPSAHRLQVYSRLTVNIRFSYGSQQREGYDESSTSSLITNNRQPIVESEAFERAFSHQLLNAEQAARFAHRDH